MPKESAALMVALVAEKPPGTFTRHRALRIELTRARYLAGITRKPVHETDKVSVITPWTRHVKLRPVTTGATRFT